LPERSEIQERSEKSQQHHRDANGVDVKAFGEMECGGGQDNGTDADE
jgi:hypothetical protein